MAAEIKATFPHFLVVSNVRPPRMKSFEVYYNNKLLFSKLETNKFPNMEDLLKVIEDERAVAAPAWDAKRERILNEDKFETVAYIITSTIVVVGIAVVIAYDRELFIIPPSACKTGCRIFGEYDSVIGYTALIGVPVGVACRFLYLKYWMGVDFTQ